MTLHTLGRRSKARLLTALVPVLCVVAGFAASGHAWQGNASEKPFAVEYYYKVKWGSADEFIRLYKKIIIRS